MRLDDGYVIYCRRRGVIENLGLGYDCCGIHCRRTRQGINLSLQCPLPSLLWMNCDACCTPMLNTGAFVHELMKGVDVETRTRTYAEIAAIIALLASLLFVGWELKLTRDMNLVQLHYNRLSLYQDRFTAALGSEVYLNMWSKILERLGFWRAHASRKGRSRSASAEYARRVGI